MLTAKKTDSEARGTREFEPATSASWRRVEGASCAATVRQAKASAVHDQAAVDAEGLTRHVLRAWRHQESYHAGDVLRALHAPQGDLVDAPAGELLGRLLEQRRLLP